MNRQYSYAPLHGLMLLAVITQEVYLVWIMFHVHSWHTLQPFLFAALAIGFTWYQVEKYRHGMPIMYALMGLIMVIATFIK